MRILAFTLATAIAFTAVAGASAQTRVQPTPPKPPVSSFQKKAPAPAKPDYVIEHASAIGGKDNEFMVKVKNASSVNAPGALLQSVNMAKGNSGAATTPFPPIKAGQHVWVKVVLNKPARAGDRILVFADHNNAVAEINEKNNKYAFNW